jgi:hypothetical protein
MATPPRGPADYLELGDWNAACYQCGRKFKASQLKKHWQGYWVCAQHWEPRHPQDFVRSIVDNMMPPWVQPESDTFIDFCTPNGITAIVDYAVVDCAVVEYISPAFIP